MRREKICAIVLLCALMLGMSAGIAGCSNGQSDHSAITTNPYRTFRDVPDITDDEIAAIEALQKQGRTFVYGADPSTEAFDNDGEIGGFSALVCEWLSELFEMPFTPAIYQWDDLLAGLEDFSVDFNGDLTPTEERIAAGSYFMTDPIAIRPLKYYRIESDTLVQEIERERPLRLVFFEGAATYDQYRAVKPQDGFEPLFVWDSEEAYELIESGQADALVEESHAEAAYDVYGNVLNEDFSPLIYSPVAMTTRNPELQPIISIVTKALRNGATTHLLNLHSQGDHEYRRHKFILSLSVDEIAYLLNATPVPIAAYYSAYPICFYNERAGRWEGMAMDILDEMRLLTGLEFEIIHEGSLAASEMMELLESGAAHLMPYLAITPERLERFDWTQKIYFTDRFALLSKQDYPNIELNEILYARVGVARGTASAEMLSGWFPDALYVKEYPTESDAFAALDNGDVDFVMTIQSRLAALTNYYELSDYKANYTFRDGLSITMAVNKNQNVLHSILDKALPLINTDRIVEQWMTRTYNFENVRLQAQRPWLIGIIILSSALIVLLFVFLLISRKSSAKLKRSMKMLLEADEEKHAIEEEQKHLREIQERLQNAILREQEANQLKSQFVAHMSHEIRTPMNAILGITEIELQKDSLPDDTEESLSKIYESGDLLLNIINDILDLSKIEAGKLEISPNKYDIPSLINDAVQINRARYESKPIEFFLEIDADTPLNLLGDELRIKQILNNILSNAYKYTEKGEVRLSVSAEGIDGLGEGADCEGSGVGADNDVTLILRVSDTGQGMTEEQLDKIFVEYTRFNMNVNKATAGTGLGMSITKRLLDLMGGEILVESKPGKGSVFTVRIPQKRVNGMVCGAGLAEKVQNFRFHSSAMAKRSRMLREHMPYGSILLVDDVEINIYVAKGIMLPYGMQMDSANSGAATIEKIKDGNVYDIIFMDHMMPEMDGIEATRILREMGYANPIVALTANALVGQVDMFMRSGFDGYISKPIDSRELNSMLNRFVRDRKPPEIVAAARREQRAKAEPRHMRGSALLRGSAERRGAAQQRGSGINPAKMKEMFVGDAKDALSVLDKICGKPDGFDETDLDAFGIAVHGMKSALSNINEAELSDFAHKLELAAREKNLDLIRAETPAFIGELRALTERLALEIRN